MKKSEAAPIVTIAVMAFILCCVIAARFDSQQKQIDQIKAVKPQQIVNVVEVDTGLADKVEELTRENERLVMENAAMHDYIKEMGGWWEDWASKNNFPGSDVKENNFDTYPDKEVVEIGGIEFYKDK